MLMSEPTLSPLLSGTCADLFDQSRRLDPDYRGSRCLYYLPEINRTFEDAATRYASDP